MFPLSGGAALHRLVCWLIVSDLFVLGKRLYIAYGIVCVIVRVQLLLLFMGGLLLFLIHVVN